MCARRNALIKHLPSNYPGHRKRRVAEMPSYDILVAVKHAVANVVTLARRNRGIVLVLMVMAALVVAGLFGASFLSRPSAEIATRAVADSRARTAAGYLSSELRKYRLIPLMLADYPDVQNAFRDSLPASSARLNARLELIAARTDAAVIYVLDRHGITIAASNWRLPTSFVGQQYGFRPYFVDALSKGYAEQFALGTVSKRPGLFLAKRVSGATGVIVVKIEFQPLEASWAHQSGPTFVRDGNGVVIMSSVAGWQLRATRKLARSTQSAIAHARLYGEGPLHLLAPELALHDDTQTGSGQRDVQFIAATRPVAVAGWTLTALEPLEPALTAAVAEMRIVLLVAALVAVIVLGLLLRSREAKLLREMAQRNLERQVELRTKELRGANARLVRESRERERNEAKLRAAREELAQSNRLATLGQITAGVAHEINQPLTALRTFAENANLLLIQKRDKEVERNLQRILALSVRIGGITDELRNFAKRKPGRGPTAIGEAIEGALLLISDRLRQGAVKIEMRLSGNGSECVAGDRIRIEQILINLLQNACDALTAVDMPLIEITAIVESNSLRLTIADNGPGVSRRQRSRLFTSFATDKADGLGLGLMISRDLARDVGGELTYEPSKRGAAFMLTLPIA